jgi:type I restriction enzyme S subunit
MYTVKIKPDILEHRLDCSFYNPVGLAATTKLNSTLEVNKLSELVDQRRKITNGVRGPEWATSKFKLIRLQDCEHWIVNSDAAASITKRQFDENRRCKLQANDIVVAIGGYIGNAAVVVDECDAVIGQHSAVLPEPEQTGADSRFLVAYLNSRFAEAIFSRYVSGTVQAGINLEDLRDLPAPKPNGAAQKYIGDKVRQAERLRAWAKKLESEFNSSLKKAVPEAFENKSTGRKYARALTQEITYTLNPGAFDEERLRVQRYLLSLGGQRFRMLAEIIGPTTNSYKPGNTYIGLDAIASGNSQLSPSTVEQAEIAGTCRLLTEGPIIAKLRPYLNKVSYIPKRLADAVGSTELLCVSPIGSNSGWYIYGILKSELTLKQLRPLATGATHPRIDQYDVYDLVVPLLDNQESLGHLLEQAQEAYFLSTELTSAAKFLVEALIEGQLTEAELIAAEQALQAGNVQPDRRILNRLKTDGVDGQDPALFSDLDQLYSLLQQASHS